MTGVLYLVLYGGGLLGLVKGLQTVQEATGLPWWLLAPQGWLIGIALAVAWYLKKQSPSLHAWVFAGMFPVAIALVSFWGFLATETPAETWQQAVNNWYVEVNNVRAGDLGLMWLYATFFALVVIFWPVQKEDVIAKGIAAILWLGECYMLAEHFICNFIWPVQGADVVASKIVGEDAIYACSRVDLPGLIWAPTAAQIAVMLGVAWMVHRAKKGMT